MKAQERFFPVASGACSGRLAAPLWSRRPSVISLTLGSASPSRCARRPEEAAMRPGQCQR